MLRRCTNLLLTVLVVSALSGCCMEPWGGCWPCGMNWCGSQCGPKIWHEWCSLPPQCCDPCDDCGCYIGPKLNDSLYSHGNDYGRYARRQPETVEGVPAQEAVPTPAAEPYSPRDIEPYTPGPVREDEMPADPSAKQQKAVRRTSYDPPPSFENMRNYPMPARTSGRNGYRGPVDSRHASRTLAKPPRTRLFSR